MWAERARHYADPGSIERVYTDLAFAHVLLMGSQFAPAGALRLEALAHARQHGDPEAMSDLSRRCAAALGRAGAAGGGVCRLAAAGRQ
jgi:hypothetical protein